MIWPLSNNTKCTMLLLSILNHPQEFNIAAKQRLKGIYPIYSLFCPPRSHFLVLFTLPLLLSSLVLIQIALDLSIWRLGRFRRQSDKELPRFPTRAPRLGSLYRVSQKMLTKYQGDIEILDFWTTSGKPRYLGLGWATFDRFWPLQSKFWSPNPALKIIVATCFGTPCTTRISIQPPRWHTPASPSIVTAHPNIDIPALANSPQHWHHPPLVDIYNDIQPCFSE